MGSSDALRRENDARDRISRLNEAILRINGSLDLSTVLREVIDSARALTGAQYGVITTLDAGKQVPDFVSSGFTPDEHRQLTDWPDGPRLFEHLRDIPETVRWPDFPAYVRSLGFSADLILVKSMQATPMRHRGEYVGNFFLGDKEGGQEFTNEDEEMLVLFAAQAATAIANARTHQNEQRARADLDQRLDPAPAGAQPRTDTASTSLCPLCAAARARFRQPTQRSNRATQYHVFHRILLNQVLVDIAHRLGSRRRDDRGLEGHA